MKVSRIFSLLTLKILMASTLSGQRASLPELTHDQKIEDFEHLYYTLSEAYPYFGVVQRLKGIDWLNKHDIYLDKVRSTQNNEEFILALYQIVEEASVGHMDFLPTIQYPYFKQAYQNFTSNDSSYMGYLNELNKGEVTLNYYYWGTLINQIKTPMEKVSQPSSYTQNVEFRVDEKTSAAIITIHSFGYQHIEEDKDTIRSIFHSIPPDKDLIIDIQGNGGGSTDYWKQLIVQELNKDTVSYSFVYAFKNSSITNNFRPQYKGNSNLESLGFNNLPEELSSDDFSFMHYNSQITPNVNNIPHSGNIYLLVDNQVFSSSDTFAYFCKATGFAKVIGENTRGDGIGSDPFLVNLPNSGIVVRYTGEMGLNLDGTVNVETGTTPDTAIIASNRYERLSRLLVLLGN